ncbi:MAG: hypothetical protein Q9202_003363 [Teloschistes flavicans]
MNQSTSSLRPPRLESRDSLFPFLADHHLPYLVPAVFYWAIGKFITQNCGHLEHGKLSSAGTGFVFHLINTRGLLSKYKLHTSAEDLTKNRASRRDVIKFALIQQAAQCILGYLTADDTERFLSPEYAVILWAQRLRNVQMVSSQWTHYAANTVLWIIYGPDFSEPTFRKSIVEAPLKYLVGSATWSFVDPSHDPVPFSAMEMSIAKTMYWILHPLFQFVFAMVLADTFQYFTHRAFHVNKWLYKNVHSMHHDIYVPFAYGAFYNHPLETIPIDGIGFPMCLWLAGLNSRQAALFGAIWTFKTVVDHCGYDFPYNPCNIVCPNSVLFHDLHHQTWGMKYNFSVYGAFWDGIMGTAWSPHDSSAQAKYKKGREVAESKAAEVSLRSGLVEPAVGESTAIFRSHLRDRTDADSGSALAGTGGSMELPFGSSGISMQTPTTMYLVFQHSKYFISIQTYGK